MSTKHLYKNLYCDWLLKPSGAATQAFDSQGRLQYEDANYKNVVDSIVADNKRVLHEPGTYYLTEVGGNPITMDNIDGLTFLGWSKNMHTGDAATKISVTNGDSAFLFQNTDGLDFGNMQIKGTASGNCPTGIEFTETTTNLDQIKVHDITVTDFQTCIDGNGCYGSSPGFELAKLSLWPVEDDGNTGRCLRLEDCSQWSMLQSFFGSQGGHQNTYGIEIVAGEETYTERIYFRNCQTITHLDGLRLNTAGQFGLLLWVSGIFENCTNPVHLVQAPTSRRTLTTIAADHATGGVKDFLVTAGEAYGTIISPYWFTPAKLDAGWKFNWIDPQMQGNEWSMRDIGYGQGFVAGSTGTTNAVDGTRYFPLNGYWEGSGFTAQNDAAQRMPLDGTITRCWIDLETDPAAGNSWTLTLMDQIGHGAGWNVTPVTVTVTSPAVFAESLTTEASFERDYYYCWRLVANSNPDLGRVSFGAAYEPGIKHGTL